MNHCTICHQSYPYNATHCCAGTPTPCTDKCWVGGAGGSGMPPKEECSHDQGGYIVDGKPVCYKCGKNIGENKDCSHQWEEMKKETNFSYGVFYYQRCKNCNLIRRI